MDRHGDIDVVVRDRVMAADGVVLLSLTSAAGAVLPVWSPGAHIDVIIPGGQERQYSLCGDPLDRQSWRIGVLREKHVSAYLHDEIVVGSRLLVRGPRNHFAFAPFPGKRYLFIAGGIGVTAIYPMLASARRAGNEFRLIYAGRSRSSMAFAADFTRDYSAETEFFTADQGLRADLAAQLADPDDSTLIYCCGPARLIDAVETAAAHWPRGALHIERFEAKVLGPPVWNEPFDVELMMSGETVTVPPEKTILEVVEERGILIVSSCRVGTCGTCEVPVVDGDVEHRDSVLSPEEQEDNFAMMICVSRAAGPKITIEL